MLIADLLPQFDRHLRARRYASLTAVGYLEDLRRCERTRSAELGRPARLADVSADWLQAYVDELPLSASTIQRHGAALRHFFRYVGGVLKVGADVAKDLSLPRLPRRRLPPVLSTDQAERLVEAPLQGEPDELTVFRLRDAAILDLLYGAGLRNSELGSIDVATLQFRPEGYCSFRVIGKGDKERLVVVEKGKTVEAIRRYLGRRDEIPGAGDCPALFLSWWGGRLGRKGVYLVARKWGLKIGLKVWAHLLRHTYATVMVAACGEALRGVQELLGHDDPATTARYAQIDEARLRKTARKHPRANPDPTWEEIGTQAGGLLKSTGRMIAAWYRGRRAPVPG